MLVVVFSARIGGRGLVDLDRECVVVHIAWGGLILLVLDHQRDIRPKETSDKRLVPT